MFQALGHDGLHMVVGQGIVDGLAIPPEPDQLHLLQNPQLMGDGALGHGKLVGNVLDAKLLPDQTVQDSDSGGIAEDLEQFGQSV